jgi:dTDP-4-dehydrorhamnose 3,5-epimerase
MPPPTGPCRALNVIETAIPGVLIIEPKVFGDARGFFLETFHEKRYAQSGIGRHFVQDNLSRSAPGVSTSDAKRAILLACACHTSRDE